MRKSIFCTLYIVTLSLFMTLAFTSCDQNNADNPLVGTWDYNTGESILSVIFKANNSCEFRDYVYGDKSKDCNYFEGTYTINGDIITAHITGHGWYYDGVKEPVVGWEPEDEKMKFSINGNTLTLTRYYGEDYAFTNTYTKQ